MDKTNCATCGIECKYWGAGWVNLCSKCADLCEIKYIKKVNNDYLPSSNNEGNGFPPTIEWNNVIDELKNENKMSHHECFCDHCGSNIPGISYKPTSWVFWCKNCINTDNQKLINAGVGKLPPVLKEYENSYSWSIPASLAALNKIPKIFFNKKLEELKKDNFSSLEEGDRLELEITNPDSNKSFNRNCTFIALNSVGQAVVALDEPYTEAGWASGHFNSTYKNIASKYNIIDIAKPVSWIIYKNGETKIKQILPPAVKKVNDLTIDYNKDYSLLEEGDMLEISIYDAKLGTSAARKATVLTKSDRFTIVALNTTYHSSYMQSSDFTNVEANIAKKYSINTFESLRWELEPSQTKILSVTKNIALKTNTQESVEKKDFTMKQIDYNEDYSLLKEGDKLSLTIYDSSLDDGEVEVEATFLMLDHNGQVMVSLDEPYETDEYSSQPWNDDYDGQTNKNLTKCKEIAKKYKINSDEETIWSFNYDEETHINKIIKHQTPFKENPKMPLDIDGNEMTWSQIFVQDSGKAAIRSGANIGIDALKAAIRKILASKGVSGPGADAVMSFFSDPLGEAALRAALGYGLLALPIPMIQENQYAQKVSEELRVSGQSMGIDKGVGMLQEFVVPALMEAFADTPLLSNFMSSEEAQTKARVAETPAATTRVADKKEESQHVELTVEPDPFKSAKQMRA